MTSFASNDELSNAIENAEKISYPMFPMDEVTFVEAYADGSGVVKAWGRIDKFGHCYQPEIGVVYEKKPNNVYAADATKIISIYNTRSSVLEKWGLFEFKFTYQVREVEEPVHLF